jgi:hypothetical protein
VPTAYVVVLLLSLLTAATTYLAFCWPFQSARTIKQLQPGLGS